MLFNGPETRLPQDGQRQTEVREKTEVSASACRLGVESGLPAVALPIIIPPSPSLLGRRRHPNPSSVDPTDPGRPRHSTPWDCHRTAEKRPGMVPGGSMGWQSVMAVPDRSCPGHRSATGKGCFWNEMTCSRSSFLGGVSRTTRLAETGVLVITTQEPLLVQLGQSALHDGHGITNRSQRD